ncbi:MAG: DUF5666 domain-containing protein [Bryobacteraceae bacterium]|nr:DUF5666 domain-containing protein [Bryobacteraceae bacterium]
MRVTQWATVLLLGVTTLAAQTRVMGVWQGAEGGAGKIKTDNGEVTGILLLPETRYQKIAPGERDLSKAQEIGIADLAVGDRVLARGVSAGGVLTAQSLIVITRGDLQQKQEREAAAWRERSVAGLVTKVDTGRSEFVLRIPSLMGEAQVVTVAVAESTRLRRYAPDSVRFADAKPSKLAEIEAGDQVRVLGDKSADGTRVTAEEIVSGRFQTIAGTVVSAAENRVELKELGSGKALVVEVTKDSRLRRLPSLPREGSMPPGGMPAGGPMMAGPPPGMPGGAGPGAGGPDLMQMIERMPAVSAADLKAGETVIVSSTRGADPATLKAITMLAGAEMLIQMQQAMAAMRSGRQGGPPNAGPGGMWNIGEMPMMMGIP